jgi:hypothetical protein
MRILSGWSGLALFTPVIEFFKSRIYGVGDETAECSIFDRFIYAEP